MPIEWRVLCLESQMREVVELLSRYPGQEDIVHGIARVMTDDRCYGCAALTDLDDGGLCFLCSVREQGGLSLPGHPKTTTGER